MTIDTSREAVERLLDDVTPGPWEYIESVSPDGQEWMGCGVCDAFGDEFLWDDGNADKSIPVCRFIAAARDLVPALLAERDAALAEVARLSTPPDDAEVLAIIKDVTFEAVNSEIDRVLAGRICQKLARLYHALAAETAKREAMEEALTGLLEPFGDDPCRYDHHGKCQEHFIEDDCCVARARATLAKHGSKT